jgi:hypothetical protein
MPDEDFRKSTGHHDVFISYAQEDKPVADTVCARLESHNIRCWIAPRDIAPGKSFPEAIIEGIDEGDVVVLIFSSYANKSPHVTREMTNAVNKGRIIIPFRIEDVRPSKSMEYLLSVPHWLDAVNPPLENHIVVLIKTIECILHTDKTSVACTPEATAGVRIHPPAVSQPAISPPPPAAPPSRPPRHYVAAAILIILIVAAIALPTGMFIPANISGLSPGDTTGINRSGQTDAGNYRGSEASVNTVILTTGPTQTLAKDTELVVEVNKDSSNAMVTVQFAGGPGIGRVKENRVILTRSDGTVVEGKLDFNRRMSEVELQGTRGTDRVQVIVTTISGETKSILDTLLPYRQY